MMDGAERAVATAAAALITSLGIGTSTARNPVEEAFVRDGTATVNTIDAAERGGFGLGGGGERLTFEQGPGRSISDRKVSPDFDTRADQTNQTLTFSNGTRTFELKDRRPKIAFNN